MAKSFEYTATAVGGAGPESGALTFVTVRNSSTPYVTYTNSGLTTPAENPEPADSDGRVGPLYFADDADITFTVKTSNRATTLLEVDYRNGFFSWRYIQTDQVAIGEIDLEGDGVTVTFDVPNVAISSPFNAIVTIDALLQPTSAYNVATDGTDTAITFDTAPPDGSVIQVRTFALQALSSATPSLSGLDASAAVVIPTGATSGQTLAASAREVFRVKAGWGGAAAVGNGVADDGAAINRAIVACNAAGGGEVFIPEGTYIIEATSGVIGVSMLSNVRLRGAGVGATILKLKSGAEAHVVQISGLSNCSVSHLSIDGTRAGQTTEVHGIRLGGTGLTNQNIRLEHLEVYDTAHYGIGIQGGTNKDITARSIELHDIGADGFDVKNIEDANENFVIDDLSVRRWGLAGGSAQAALDMRGAVSASNIYVVEPNNNDAVGIRFRNGELLDTNGLGAHRATLTGFYVDMGTKTTAQGLSVGARDVMASNGYVRGGQDGVTVLDSTFRGTAITVEACSDDGFFLQAAGSGLDGDGAILTGCAARDCTDNGFRIDTDNVQLIGCEATGNDDGVVIAAGADSTRILGGRYASNTTTQVSDGGTNTRIRDAIGVTNKLPGEWRVIAQSAVQLTHTGDTSKTALATVSIPGGTQGLNGIVKVTSNWACTGSTNSKTLSWEFGGTTLFSRSETNASIIGFRDIREVYNRNSLSSQMATRAASTVPLGQLTTGATAVAAVNTANDVDLIFYATLTNSGESITLESYIVEVLYAA